MEVMKGESKGNKDVFEASSGVLNVGGLIIWFLRDSIITVSVTMV